MQQKLLSICLSIIFLYTAGYTKENSIEDERLRLMYDSFVFSQDLEHAYETAKKAILKYPTSLDWHQKMAEIASWTGNSNESIEHLTYIYNHTDDPEITNTVIDKMLTGYQYEKALPIINKKVLANTKYDNKNIQNVLDIHHKVGRPDESIKILQKLHKKNPSVKYLSDMLSIYLETGEIQKAKTVIKKIEKYNNKSAKTALLLSKYYFFKKDIPKAYAVLKSVKTDSTPQDTKYFEQLSDLGWYMNDQKNAVYGSLMLFKNKNARLIDYVRINEIYKNSDTHLIQQVSLEAIEKYKDKMLFLEYAYNALSMQKFNELNAVFQKVLSQKNYSSVLEKSPQFWLIKASIDEYFKKDESVKVDFEKALLLSPDSSHISVNILWHLIDHFKYETLKKEVKKIESSNNISPDLWHPLSAANLALQKSDKAMFYLEKCLKNNPNDMDLRFLHTEILFAKGKRIERDKELKSILNTLQSQSNKNPDLLKNKLFVRQYLQTSLEFLPEKKFQKLLKDSKTQLTKKDYQQLQLLYALKYKKQTLASSTFNSLTYQNPAVAMEIAHLSGDTKLKQKLIQDFDAATPIYFKVENEKTKNNIPNAINITKNSLTHNKNNPELIQTLNYLQHKYKNNYSFDLEHTNRGSLKTTRTRLYNFNYIKNGYGLITEIENFYYHDNFLAEEDNDPSLHIGILKQIKNGEIEARVTYRDKSEVGFKLAASNQINDSLAINLALQNKMRINEASMEMIMSGNKENALLGINYTVAPNQELLYVGNYSKYYTKYDTKVGRSIESSLEWNYTFMKNPNIGMRFLYNYGTFKEEKKPFLLRDKKLLGYDYHDKGIGFFYGNNDEIFGNSIQPYVDINAYHSKNMNQIHANISTGIIGSISNKDMYHLYLHYWDNTNRINQEEASIRFNYARHY